MGRTQSRSALALLLVALAGTAGAQETVVAGDDGVGVPKRRKLVRPEYPPQAAAEGKRGIVILELIIAVDGTIDEVNVVRSVPPFDEPAVAAAQAWEYEPTVIDGQPVRVKLTVPISFLMKLPEITREEGIPELRQGAIPRIPPEAGREAKVKAEITLMPGGEVAEAQVVEGDSPWSEALILALRTWRFDANQVGDDIVTFRAEARFIPENRGKESRVPIKLSNLQRRPAEVPTPAEPASAAEAPADASGQAASPAESPTESPSEARQAPKAPVAPPETPEPVPGQAMPTAETEASETAEEAPTADAEAPAPESPPVSDPPEQPQPELPAPAGPVAEASEPEPGSEPEPPTDPETQAPTQPVSDEPAGDDPALPAAAIETTPVESGPPEMVEQPATEVMTLAPAANPGPPPRSDEPGVSAVQGVFLGAGLPDLTSGRRPVVPPFARMDGAVGDVTVDFAITPAGTTVVRGVQGPDVFQAAAREAVQSWFFVRETADRLFASAAFSYAVEGASVLVALDANPQ